MLDRASIGYKQGAKQRAFKDKCLKITFTKSPFVTCHYCGRKGHYTHECAAKKKKTNHNRVWIPKGSRPKEEYFSSKPPVLKNVKKVWVPKGTTTNPTGPKMVWVPKFKGAT